MRKKTDQEEQTTQLKLISAQIAPLGVFVRVGLYLAAFLLAAGFLDRLFTTSLLARFFR